MQSYADVFLNAEIVFQISIRHKNKPFYEVYKTSDSKYSIFHEFAFIFNPSLMFACGADMSRSTQSVLFGSGEWWLHKSLFLDL